MACCPRGLQCSRPCAVEVHEANGVLALPVKGVGRALRRDEGDLVRLGDGAAPLTLGDVNGVPAARPGHVAARTRREALRALRSGERARIARREGCRAHAHPAGVDPRHRRVARGDGGGRAWRRKALARSTVGPAASDARRQRPAHLVRARRDPIRRQERVAAVAGPERRERRSRVGRDMNARAIVDDVDGLAKRRDRVWNESGVEDMRDRARACLGRASLRRPIHGRIAPARDGRLVILVRIVDGRPDGARRGRRDGRCDGETSNAYSSHLAANFLPYARRGGPPRRSDLRLVGLLAPLAQELKVAPRDP